VGGRAGGQGRGRARERARKSGASSGAVPRVSLCWCGRKEQVGGREGGKESCASILNPFCLGYGFSAAGRAFKIDLSGLRVEG